MPEKATLARAQRDKREGKAPTTQAGEFVREEIHHVREGKHGATSPKQVIAIGLSKARRAGVKLPLPPAGTKRKTKQRATGARRTAASRRALAQQAKTAARRRSSPARPATARRAAHRRRASA